MSISVKNIAVSIDGKQSEQFYIELYGSRFVMEDFSLTQRLLEPCFLSFNLHKGAEEDINDIEFNVPANIIGTEVTLQMETESMEQSIEGFEEGSQNSIIEFKGFITDASASRASDNDYNIHVNAVTHDGKMYTNPNCFMYNQYTLAAIVSELVSTEYKVDVEGTTAHQDEIFYTVQYNEGDYQFLQRLASRYGEWMYNTGTKLHFGKLENQESIQLTYPSQDVPSYNVKLQSYHQQNVNTHDLYQRGGPCYAGFGYGQKEVGHKLNDAVFNASLKRYPRMTLHVEPGTTMESEKDAEKYKPQQERFPIPGLGETSMAQINGQRINMVLYNGSSYCSRLKIGTKLTINDNYISDENGQKSEVKQDEILITGVTHSFNVNLKYENTFEGIPAVFNYPPYYNPVLYPQCYNPVRATVIDTEDPKHWGRVRVRFDWQIREYQGLHGNKEKNGISPWIHVLQSYTGGNVGDGGLYGTFIIPEIYSYVMVAFEEGNMERPYVLGTFFNFDRPIDPKWCPGQNNVKAFRSASGHTIEIHDTQTSTHVGEKGYIRVYDNYHHTYELLLSTDRALIKLKSAGNIELEAGKDIALTAGHNIKLTAKKENIFMVAKKNIDMSAVDEDIKGGAGKNITWTAGKDCGMDAGNNIWTQSDNDTTFTCEKKGKFISKQEEIRVIGKNMVAIGACDDNSTLTAGGKVTVSAKTLQLNGDEKTEIGGTTTGITLDQQNISSNAMSFKVNCTSDVNLTATAKIDLNAPIVNEP